MTSPVRAGQLVRRPSFAAFLAGNCISAAGTQFQQIAQALLMFRLTGSTFLVGLTVFAQFIGVFGCAPIAAAAADRFDRRRLLLRLSAASCALSAVLAALVGFDMIDTVSLLGLVLATGILHNLTQPVLQSFVPQLVEPHELSAGVSLSNTSFTVARTIGPIAAAAIVATLGLAAAFVVNAISFTALIGALALVRPRPVEPAPHRSPSFRAGLSVARQHPQVVRALVATAGIVVAIEPVGTLAPELVTAGYRASDAAVGLLVGAFGVGATAAGVLLGRFRHDPAVAIPVGMMITGAGLAGVASADRLALGMVAFTVMGLGYLHCTTTAMTVLLGSTPAAQHGLIMAIWSIAFFGSRPVAALLVGGLATVSSARVASSVLAAMACALAVLMRWWPSNSQAGVRLTRSSSESM